MTQTARRTGGYASLLEQAFPNAGPALTRATSLLRAPAVDAEAALLDAHCAQTRRYVDAVEGALDALDRRGWIPLQLAKPLQRPPEKAPQAELVDAIARWLTESLRGRSDEALALAVATGRLIEEGRRLTPASRRTTPLGRGFEDRLDDRLRLRFAVLVDQPELVAVTAGRLLLLLETPEEGRAAIERDLGRPLSATEAEWLEAERFAGMLDHTRGHKADDHHIRWFLRRRPDGVVVLDRYGAHGHWLVVGDGGPQALAWSGTLAARAAGDRDGDDDDPLGWRALGIGNPAADADPNAVAPLTEDAAVAAVAAAVESRASHTPPRRTFALTAAEGTLRLHAAGREPLAAVPLAPGDDELLSFLDALGRVADTGAIRDDVDAAHDREDAVRWARALLRRSTAPAKDAGDLAGRDVRLVYVPSRQPHPLGGLPLIGLRYLADHLERAGARAEIVAIRPEDLERRLPELLGADVLGISVYVTNRDEVRDLLPRLRAAGYPGRIVLGGPEVRDVDGIAAAIDGWDALIRGEGEDALVDVVRVFAHLDAGRVREGLTLARTLRGVVLAQGRLTLLADTAARNAVEEIRLPLPFEWRRHEDERCLHMNFTRGCPYGCGFCPNHQGRRAKPASPDAMWEFMERAAADATQVAPAAEERRAAAVLDALGLDAPARLRPALNLLFRGPVSPGALAALGAEPATAPVTPWEGKRRWLQAQAATVDGAEVTPFEVMTSEDNTLVNKDAILALLARRRASGLAPVVSFNPGQNTVRDLTDHRGHVDEEYLDALSADNPFKIVLGVDGTSNAVLRQNHKPYYTIAEAVAVNRALTRRGMTVLNNYILITPETDLLEAVEAMLLYVMLPLNWRDHGDAINLRIVKEAGTVSHDEGLLFAPDDEHYDDPLRFPEVEALLERNALHARVRSADLVDVLWRTLDRDDETRRMLPLVLRRWERDFDGDSFLVALAARVHAAATPDHNDLVTVLREVADTVREEWLDAPDLTGAQDEAAGAPVVGRAPRQRDRGTAPDAGGAKPDVLPVLQHQPGPSDG